MSLHCFNREYFPVARRGFTPIEAVEFLRKEFPSVGQWTFWRPSQMMCHTLGMMAGKGHQTEGRIGNWSWSRVSSSYPTLLLWDGYSTDPARGDDWIGVLKIRGEKDEEFFLFSFLNSLGAIGQWYLASTPDVQVLDRFGRAVQGHFHSPDRLVIEVQGGPDIVLNTADDEALFLPDQLREDIERQVFSFFENAEHYRRWQLRHRRGFLFVGTPGNGKTKMLRHLVRQCHRRYHVTPLMLSIVKDTEDRDVATLFREAARKTPALVILEDLDSLTTECRVSRAHLLAQLDGLDSSEGVLVIGTTNNPHDIDPALVHRPSRFDRVWHFPLPDSTMRRRYLQWAFEELDTTTVATMVEQTGDWSYAYLNELRTTAAILAMDHNPPSLTDEDVGNALDLLAEQFQAGRRNHVASGTGEFAGFRATQLGGFR